MEADRPMRARRGRRRRPIVAIAVREREALVLPVLALLLALLPGHAAGEEVWSGRDYYFEKQDYADWTLEANQDRITDQVWITRKDNQGIFNIAQEEGYQPLHSPQDTEWATGDAADWPNLSFRTWQDWTGSYPLGTVGVDAVVHLISEDIYVDIRFESWTAANAGGGFSYQRAGGRPTFVESTSWGRIRALFQ